MRSRGGRRERSYLLRGKVKESREEESDSEKLGE